MEPDPDPFTYRSLNYDPDPVFNGSEPPSNRRIEDPITSLLEGLNYMYLGFCINEWAIYLSDIKIPSPFTRDPTNLGILL